MKRPAQLSLLGFASAIAVGTALLLLPISTRSGSLSLVDALFTATSAVCVTGLIVVDTGQYFTPFGQFVIMLLIQVGGLGIMTISTGLLIGLGRRASIQAKMAMAEDMAVMRVRDHRYLVRSVVLLTLGFEVVGFVCLLPVFWREHGFLRGAWLAAFHAVSAFCNAGFSLYSDSLCAYRTNLWLNVVVCALIVAGGIGFVVLWDLWQCRPRGDAHRSRLTLHTKLVLSATGVLIVAGTLLVWGIERNVSLAGMGWFGQLQCAFFQSVTARTAGFNTIAIDQMSNATLFILAMLMFVGASPCSTGGGIKTTTVAVLVAVALSRFRGRESASIAKRRVPANVVSRSVTLALAATVLVCLFTAMLMIVEQGEVAHVQSRGMFLSLFFEAVSAFGTVGLSMGATSTLSVAGKLLVTLLMYIGRVGPVALMLALAKREGADPIRYPDESVVIG